MLESVEAKYRDPAGRHIVPTVEKLATFRLSLMHTRLGPFDALASIHGAGYEELLEDSRLVELGDLGIRVLGLAKIIESKEMANRDKDRAVLPILRKTLEMKERGS